MSIKSRSVALLAWLFNLPTLSLFGDNQVAILTVDLAADRRPIHPEIYGVAFASAADLKALNVPVNRHGGDLTMRYNWKLDSTSVGSHWYFESAPVPATITAGPWFSPGGKTELGVQPGAFVDNIIANSRAGGANPMITIPISGWVSKLGPGRTPLWSYSIQKYGPQAKHDPKTFPDAGDGIRTSDGSPIDNDLNDANQPATPAFQREWIEHLIKRWGKASDRNVRYYLMDNEPSLWWLNHSDVSKTGTTGAELRDVIVAYATMVRATDPDAVIAGPEEWGWNAFFYSGLDQQWGDRQKKLTGSYPDRTATFPDRKTRGGMDYIPWLLQELHARERMTGVRLLDVFTFHIYPQEGEFSDDVSPAMQLARNRSTRILWDPAYRDPSWINDVVRLIPRMRELVAEYYPGRAIGITEYDWGAAKHINGATAQADILGIFGREGLDIATHWISPAADTPIFKTFQLYRNYDGKNSIFGDTRVRLSNSANVDNLSAFAAERSSDGALTVMIVAKDLSGATPVELKLSNFITRADAQVWQLTAVNRIDRLVDLSVNGDHANLTVPAQSVTLLVIPKVQ